MHLQGYLTYNKQALPAYRGTLLIRNKPSLQELLGGVLLFCMPLPTQPHYPLSSAPSYRSLCDRMVLLTLLHLTNLTTLNLSAPSSLQELLGGVLLFCPALQHLDLSGTTNPHIRTKPPVSVPVVCTGAT